MKIGEFTRLLTWDGADVYEFYAKKYNLENDFDIVMQKIDNEITAEQIQSEINEFHRLFFATIHNQTTEKQFTLADFNNVIIDLPFFIEKNTAGQKFLMDKFKVEVYKPLKDIDLNGIKDNEMTEKDYSNLDLFAKAQLSLIPKVLAVYLMSLEYGKFESKRINEFIETKVNGLDFATYMPIADFFLKN